MTPGEKKEMLRQVAKHKEQVTKRLFELDRADIPEMLDWFFSIMTPTGGGKVVWGEDPNEPYIENAGAVLELSNALFVIHKLKYEIEAENWPAILEYGTYLGKALPGAAKGIFYDNKKRSQHTGGKRKNLELYQSIKPFALKEAARLWSENPARPLTGPDGIAGAVLAEMDRLFFENDPDGERLAETTVCTWIRETDRDPQNSFRRPPESKKRGRPREK